jgi:protein SCO1/2
MFHPRLIGLTGSAEAIRKAADAYKVYYARVDPPKEDVKENVKEDGGYYTVDHTAYIYLMDRDGNYLGFFPPGTSADRMVEIIRPRLGETAH